MKELTCLGYWENTEGLTANTQWRPSASSGAVPGELDTREVAEIKYIEIQAPVVPADPEAEPPTDAINEDLASIYLMLDDEPTQNVFNLSGRNDTNMAPHRQHIVGGMQIPLGMGIVDAMKGQRPLLDNTTLKYRTSVRPVFTAGGTNVTQPFSIKLWGYRYTESDLIKALGGNTNMPGSLSVVNVLRGRTFSVERPSIPINWDNWDQLPGGPKQPKPSIMPFARWAVNAEATTLNTPYTFRFETGKVATEEQDLYWNYDQKDRALLIRGVGIRHATNLKYAAIVNTAEAKDHPKGRILLSATDNPLHFGQATPVMDDEFRYFPIPRFCDTDHLIWNDLAYLAIWDNGATAVAANTVRVAVNGVAFDLKK